MSYDIFKKNMLSYMRNQRAIGSKEDFAKKLVQEYDSLVRNRGYDMINKISVSTGNTELMESTLVGILNTAFQQSAGEHPLYTNLGPAFQAYWTGATLNLLPPPLPTAIPTPAIHIAQVSNSILNTGTWNGTDSAVIPPENTEEETDDADFDELERQAIEDANNQLDEDDGQQTFVEFGGFDIDYGGPKTEITREQIKRGVGQSNAAGKGRKGASSLSDDALFKLAGRGELWPAIGTPGNFEVNMEVTAAANKRWWNSGGVKDHPLAQPLANSDEVNAYLQKTGGKGVRVVYKTNPEFQTKYMTSLKYSVNGKEVSRSFHVDIVSLLQPGFDEVKRLGLDRYVKQVGGFNVRNVSNSTRLSNHAWGCGVDINQDDYPGMITRFAEDGIYKSSYDSVTKKNIWTKERDYNEQDLGFCRVIEVLLKNGGGSLQWLTDNDPMHISLYENTWNGVPSFVKPFG